MSNTTVPPEEAVEPVVVDADVVDENPPERPTPVAGTDVAVRGAGGATPTLFRDYGEDPAAMMTVAERFASSFKDVLDKQHLTSRIGNKDHVDIEGWQTIGRLAGVAVQVTSKPVCHPVTGQPLITRYDVHVKDYEWVVPDGGGKKVKRLKAERDYTVEGHDWEATATAILPDGTLVGSSDAMCSRSEDKWAKDDDTALRGMAQTRASSRAYRAALGWVVHMAGYAGTPTEEMDGAVARADRNQEADDDLKYTASTALITLLGDEQAARKLWVDLKTGFDGAMPVAAAQAIVAIALAVSTSKAPPTNGNGNGHQAAPAAAEPAATGGEVVNGEQVMAIGKAFDAFEAPLRVRKAVLKVIAGVTSIPALPVGLADPVLALAAKVKADAPDNDQAVVEALARVYVNNGEKPLGGDVGKAIDAIHDLNVTF